MFLKIFFVLLQGVFNIQACGPYFVSHSKTTWEVASTKRTFATPDIYYNEQNLSINISLELRNEKVWIGYFGALTAFEYFGCMHEESINSSKTLMLDSNRPGLCFSACGKQLLVGLRLKMCYCLTNLPTGNHHLPNCDNTCEAEKEFLCGGDGHISLYKFNYEATLSKEISTRDNENNKCLQLDNNSNSKIKRWKPCSLSFKTMCSFENGTILSGGWSEQWKDATQRCFQFMGYATGYVNTTFNFRVLPLGTSWTGVVRSSVIYKYDEIDNGNFSKIECGYTLLSQTEPKEVLFTDKCNSTLRHVLCRYETSSTVIAPSTYMSTSELIRSDSGSKPDKTTLSSNISSDKWSGTNTNAQEMQYKGSDVGAIIGASVASILVVIAAVAVIVIILKRRQNNQSEHQTKMGNLSEQANYITPISAAADDRIYINVKDNDTGGANDGYEIPNPQRNVYESLHGRGNEDHYYETTTRSSSGF